MTFSLREEGVEEASRRAIIFCDHTFPSETAQASRIHSLAIGLASINYNLTIISPLTEMSTDLIKRHEIRLENHRSFITLVQFKQFGGAQYYLKSFVYLFNIIRSGSLCYISSAHPLQHLLSFFLRLMQPVPIILDVGEWHSLKGLLKSKQLKSFAIEWLNRKVLIKGYSGAAAISSAISLKCQAINLPSFVMPALLPASLGGINYALTSKSSYKKDGFRLFYSGTLKEEDGIMELLNALCDIESSKPGMFLLSTSGSFSKESLLRSIDKVTDSRQHMLDKIDHKGWLADADYQKEILASDLVIIPRPASSINNQFSFPTRLVQALALGIPVAVSDTSDIPQYLQPDQHYISLGDGSRESIVRALEVSSLQTRIEAVKARIPEVVPQFDPSLHAKNLLAFAASLSKTKQ